MDRGFWSGLAVFALALAAETVSAGPILLVEDQGGFGGASAVLESNGFDTAIVNNEYANGHVHLLDASFLGQFDFVVYGERGDGLGALMSQNVADSLEQYIQSGGDLLVTGFDTLGSPFDPILAALVRSSTAGDNASFDATWETAGIDHPILNGPFGDFRGETFEGSGLDDDNLTADNLSAGSDAIALATTPGDVPSEATDRLIIANVGSDGGSVGYWNGGLSTVAEQNFGFVNAQPDFSFGGQPQNIFLNYAAYAVDAPVVPEPASATLLAIGGCGLLAGWRRRRRALS